MPAGLTLPLSLNFQSPFLELACLHWLKWRGRSSLSRLSESDFSGTGMQEILIKLLLPWKKCHSGKRVMDSGFSLGACLAYLSCHVLSTLLAYLRSTSCLLASCNLQVRRSKFQDLSSGMQSFFHVVLRSLHWTNFAISSIPLLRSRTAEILHRV